MGQSLVVGVMLVVVRDVSRARCCSLLSSHQCSSGGMLECVRVLGLGPPQSGSVTNLSTALVPAPLARGAAVASQKWWRILI